MRRICSRVEVPGKVAIEEIQRIGGRISLEIEEMAPFLWKLKIIHLTRVYGASVPCQILF